MKTALVYLLLMTMLLPSISPWGTVVYYQANKEYIARVLCVNRTRPELHCDGKCYLAKKLKAQQDKQDKETTERVQNTPWMSLFCTDRPSFDFRPVVLTELAKLVASYLLKSYTVSPAVIDQPPRV